MITTQSVPDAISKSVETILKSELLNKIDKKHTQNNIITLAKILNHFDKKDQNKYLKKFDKQNSTELRHIMFKFEDILYLTQQSVNTLWQIAHHDTLMIALKGASDDVQNFFLSKISPNMVKYFVEAMDNIHHISEEKICSAQIQIVCLIKSMLNNKEISLTSDHK